MAGDQMIKQGVYVIVAMGSFSLNGAIGQTVTGVTLEENDAGQTGRNTLPIQASIKTPGAQLPPPGGNPLWGIPISALTATQERPLFSATRRPPVAAQPVVEAPSSPPPPAEPEHPLLKLVGTAIGEPQNVAVVLDQTTKNLVRIHVGEAISGWFLRSVDSRTMTIEKDSQTVILALPAPGSAPTDLPAVSEATGISREF
jgi:general secretion pathway protein N